MKNTELRLRLELYEYGVLHFPSRYNECLTFEKVSELIHPFQLECARSSVIEETEDLEGTNNRPSGPKTVCITYEGWKKAAEEFFHWHVIEYKTFWTVLVFLHDIYHEKSHESPETQEIPLHELAIFLFLHTDKRQKNQFRSKEELNTFNEKWCTNDPSKSTDRMTTAGESPLSPNSKSPSLAHKMDVKDRAFVDVCHLAFIKNHLVDLMQVLFPQAPGSTSDTPRTLTSEEIDHLGFLMTAASSSDEDEEKDRDDPHRLSRAFWTCASRTTTTNLNIAPGSSSVASLKDVMDWIQCKLQVIVSSKDSDESSSRVYHGRSKTTIVVQTSGGPDTSSTVSKDDVVLSACRDMSIYICRPVRHVKIMDCINCIIMTAPAVGVVSLDRCERVKLSCVCDLLRMSNCLDSLVNVYTPRSPVLMGDNRGIQLGPFNSAYPGLDRHLRQTHVETGSSSGAWSEFINLNLDNEDEDEDGKMAGELEKEAVILQPPVLFSELVVPVRALEEEKNKKVLDFGYRVFACSFTYKRRCTRSNVPFPYPKHMPKRWLKNIPESPRYAWNYDKLAKVKWERRLIR